MKKKFNYIGHIKKLLNCSKIESIIKSKGYKEKMKQWMKTNIEIMTNIINKLILFYFKKFHKLFYIYSN